MTVNERICDIANQKYTRVYHFMTDDLGLSGSDLVVYSIIFSFCMRADDHKYSGGQEKLCFLSGMKERGLRKVISRLIKGNKIFRESNGKRAIYSINNEIIPAQRTGIIPAKSAGEEENGQYRHNVPVSYRHNVPVRNAGADSIQIKNITDKNVRNTNTDPKEEEGYVKENGTGRRKDGAGDGVPLPSVAVKESTALVETAKETNGTKRIHHAYPVYPPERVAPPKGSPELLEWHFRNLYNAYPECRRPSMDEARKIWNAVESHEAEYYMAIHVVLNCANGTGKIDWRTENYRYCPTFQSYCKKKLWDSDRYILNCGGHDYGFNIQEEGRSRWKAEDWDKFYAVLDDIDI